MGDGIESVSGGRLMTEMDADPCPSKLLILGQ
jgi:hypothetical protein